jgi:hypothetical protein
MEVAEVDHGREAAIITVSRSTVSNQVAERRQV